MLPFNGEKVAVQEHAYLFFNGKKTSYLDNYIGCCNTHMDINWTIKE